MSYNLKTFISKDKKGNFSSKNCKKVLEENT